MWLKLRKTAFRRTKFDIYISQGNIIFSQNKLYGEEFIRKLKEKNWFLKITSEIVEFRDFWTLLAFIGIISKLFILQSQG